ncbi:MAG: hypothetical protein V1837_06290 [Candidatus Woesearchaeota archaeon]
MLSDKHLIIVALTLALLGTGVLYILLLTTELPISDLTLVDKSHETETVRVVGRIESVRHGKNSTVTILTISQQVERTAIIFDEINVTKGQVIDTEGEVQMYEGEPELIIRRLGPADTGGPS